MGLPSWLSDPETARDEGAGGPSQRHPGSGPPGVWTAKEQAIYRALLSLVGSDLLRQVGRRGGPGTAFYSLLGRALALRRAEPGPDGTWVAYVRNVPRGTLPPGTGGWTWGNTIALLPEDRGNRPRLLHEYVHVLQYRREGLRFIWRYGRGGLYNWSGNRYEVQAVQVERLYAEHAWLPPLWELQGAEGG